MKSICQKTLKTLIGNINSVYNLSKFDQQILDFSLNHIKKLDERLEKNFDNPLYRADKAIKVIENIKENKSLQPQYKAMFNQCVVLLVSYFGSALYEFFKNSYNYQIGHNVKLSKIDNMKIALSEIEEYDFDIVNNIGEIIIANNNISFQDMKSIKRALKNWFNIKFERDHIENNIIIAQASRNIIVHQGSKIDSKFLNQIRSASPRDLKQKLTDGEHIQFNTSELEIIGKSMIEFFNKIEDTFD